MYHLQVSDHQRDLRGSVQNRFEPVHLYCSTFDSLKRMTKVMNNLMVMPDKMEQNLISANKYSIAEAMNAILKKYHYQGADATDSAGDLRPTGAIGRRKARGGVTGCIFVLPGEIRLGLGVAYGVFCHTQYGGDTDCSGLT